MNIWLGPSPLRTDLGWRIVDPDTDAFVELTFPGDGKPHVKAKLYSSGGESVEGDWSPDASGHIDVVVEDAYVRLVPVPKKGPAAPGDLSLEISSFNTVGERSMGVVFGEIVVPRGLNLRVLKRDGSL
jgi:hypothetical protein